MADLDDVAEIAASLPEVTEGTSYGNRAWKVGKTGFIWERPLSKADVKRLAGAPVPDGPLLGIRTDGLEEKEALLGAGIPGLFTIAHFDGYPAVLLQLSEIGVDELRELVTDAWLVAAPAKVAKAFAEQLER